LDTFDLGILDLKKLKFFVSTGGFLGLTYDEKEYKHVTLRRTMPIIQPMSYISIADHENKEIGILRSVNELTDAQQQMVVNELDNRYYSPTILEVLSVKDKLGYVYIEMRVKNKKGTEYTKSCAVKDVNRNMRMLTESSMIIFDVDGNRYIVPKINELDKNSIKKLDPYLF
jgi:hypothetical protein